MKKEVVVLIGGPGSGKTSVINLLKEQGHFCLPEVSREVILEAQKNGVEQLFLEQPLLFSELLLEGRKRQHATALQTEAEVVFIDRGIPDVLAYLHYIGDAYPAHFDRACQELRYTKIFLLPPWKEIYISDNERYENFEQSSLIYQHLLETYQGYGYELIEVPKDTVANRVHFILEQLQN